MAARGPKSKASRTGNLGPFIAENNLLKERVAALETRNAALEANQRPLEAQLIELKDQISVLEKKLSISNQIPDKFGKNTQFHKETTKPFESKEEREQWLRQLNRALRDMKKNLIWFFSFIFPLLVRGGEAFQVVVVMVHCCCCCVVNLSLYIYIYIYA